jgi:hypothetical protein
MPLSEVVTMTEEESSDELVEIMDIDESDFKVEFTEITKVGEEVKESPFVEMVVQQVRDLEMTKVICLDDPSADIMISDILNAEYAVDTETDYDDAQPLSTTLKLSDEAIRRLLESLQ